MQSFILALVLALSAAAYQVTSPSNTSSWTSTGPNTLTWNRVDTDPSTFSVVLTNEDRSVLPTNDVVLVPSVDGTSGSVQINAPSGGFPVGSGFRVNLVKTPTDVDTIYAQSNEFQIVASTSSTTSSSSSSSSSSSTSSSSPGTTLSVGTTSSTGGTSSSSSSSSSSTSPSQSLNPTNNGAVSINAKSGLIAVGIVLGAFLA